MVDISHPKCHVKFKEPQKAITPGQIVAFYYDDIVVGSAVIDEFTE